MDSMTLDAAVTRTPPLPHIDADTYKSMYAASLADPDAFWSEQAQRLDWITPFTKVKNVNFTLGQVSVKCIDRHLETRADQTAIIWEPDDPKDPALHITYRDLHTRVSKMANVLKSLGVTKGDRVIIY